MRPAHNQSPGWRGSWQRMSAMALVGVLLTIVGASLAAIAAAITEATSALPTALWALVGSSAALATLFLVRRHLPLHPETPAPAETNPLIRALAVATQATLLTDKD